MPRTERDRLNGTANGSSLVRSQRQGFPYLGCLPTEEPLSFCPSCLASRALDLASGCLRNSALRKSWSSLFLTGTLRVSAKPCGRARERWPHHFESIVFAYSVAAFWVGNSCSVVSFVVLGEQLAEVVYASNSASSGLPSARSQYGYYPVVNLVYHRTQPLTKNVVFMLRSSCGSVGLTSRASGVTSLRPCRLCSVGRAPPSFPRLLRW